MPRHLSSLDLYRRAKHGFWLFLSASVAVMALICWLDRVALSDPHARQSLALAPAAAFFLGALFPLRLLRSRGFAWAWAALGIGGACAAWARHHGWDEMALGGLGAGLGAAWGLACSLAFIQATRASFAWVDVLAPEGVDAAAALLKQAAELEILRGAPMDAAPFGSGLVGRFQGQDEFWVAVEPLPDTDDAQGAPDADGQVGAPSRRARATAGWQPTLSLWTAISRRARPQIDPLEALQAWRQSCEGSAPGWHFGSFFSQ
jgi:hypothetical protein